MKLNLVIFAALCIFSAKCCKFTDRFWNSHEKWIDCFDTDLNNLETDVKHYKNFYMRALTESNSDELVKMLKKNNKALRDILSTAQEKALKLDRHEREYREDLEALTVYKNKIADIKRNASFNVVKVNNLETDEILNSLKQLEEKMERNAAIISQYKEAVVEGEEGLATATAAVMGVEEELIAGIEQEMAQVKVVAKDIDAKVVLMKEKVKKTEQKLRQHLDGQIKSATESNANLIQNIDKSNDNAQTLMDNLSEWKNETELLSETLEELRSDVDERSAILQEATIIEKIEDVKSHTEAPVDFAKLREELSKQQAEFEKINSNQLKNVKKLTKKLGKRIRSASINFRILDAGIRKNNKTIVELEADINSVIG